MYPVVIVLDSISIVYLQAAWRGRLLRRKLRCLSPASRHFVACFDRRGGRPGVIVQTKRVQCLINSKHVSMIWQLILLFVSGLAFALHLLNPCVVEVRLDQKEPVLPCGGHTKRDGINMQPTQVSVNKCQKVCDPPLATETTWITGDLRNLSGGRIFHSPCTVP